MPTTRIKVLLLRNIIFFSYDLNFDPMTLTFKLDLDMVKTYLYITNEIPIWKCSKVIEWTDRNIDRHTDMTENITYLHTRVVMIYRQFSTNKYVAV